MTTSTSYTPTEGIRPPENESFSVVGYLNAYDSAQLAKVPVLDGLRMNVVFYNKENGESIYNPIIENISGLDITDFVLINQSTVNTAKRVSYRTFPNNNYINVDIDGIVYYDTVNFEEVKTMFSHKGKLYRCTWWGFYNPQEKEHGIHMLMEIFN